MRAFACGFLMTVSSVFASAAPVVLTVADNWLLKAETDGVTALLKVEEPVSIKVSDERLACLPIYNPSAAQYARGAKLAGMRAQECSVRYALDPESLAVRLSPDGMPLVRGKDYEAELTWGCVGRLSGGTVGVQTPVFVSYAYGPMRLDAVVLTADKKIILRKGVPHVANPIQVALAAGYRHRHHHTQQGSGKLEQLQVISFQFLSDFQYIRCQINGSCLYGNLNDSGSPIWGEMRPKFLKALQNHQAYLLQGFKFYVVAA